MPKSDNSSKRGTSMLQKTRVGEPRQYKVIFHNDDFTTMDFVVDVLMRVFGKSSIEAVSLMMAVHRQGCAVVGTYTYDAAMSRMQRATSLARNAGFPLRITCEPE